MKTIYFVEKKVEYSVKLTVGHGYTKKKGAYLCPHWLIQISKILELKTLPPGPLAPWTHVSWMAMHGSWVMDGVSSLGRWRQRKNAIAVGDARQIRLPTRNPVLALRKQFCSFVLLCLLSPASTAPLSIVLLLFSAPILVLCSVFCAQSCRVPACRRYILCSLWREEGQEDKVRRFIIINGSR